MPIYIVNYNAVCVRQAQSPAWSPISWAARAGHLIGVGLTIDGGYVL
jgi:hypothetical protein